MENFEKQQPLESRIDIIRDVISRSSEEIEEEFQRTANSWLACFGSQVFAIELMLGKKAEDELGPERYNAAMEKLEALKQKLHDLKQQYPEKNTIPPDEIKQDLLEALDVLK